MRVIFAFLLLVLVTLNVTVSICLYRARENVENQFDEYLMSVAGIAAKLLALDVGGLKDLRPGDETSSYYRGGKEVLDTVQAIGGWRRYI